MKFKLVDTNIEVEHSVSKLSHNYKKLLGKTKTVVGIKKELLESSLSSDRFERYDKAGIDELDLKILQVESHINSLMRQLIDSLRPLSKKADIDALNIINIVSCEMANCSKSTIRRDYNNLAQSINYGFKIRENLINTRATAGNIKVTPYMEASLAKFLNVFQLIYMAGTWVAGSMMNVKSSRNGWVRTKTQHARRIRLVVPVVFTRFIDLDNASEYDSSELNDMIIKTITHWNTALKNCSLWVIKSWRGREYLLIESRHHEISELMHDLGWKLVDLSGKATGGKIKEIWKLFNL